MNVENEGPINQPSKPEALPYRLPEGFEWVTIDLSNEKDLEDLYKLLCENYVEHSTSAFRFNYQPAFLRWALQSPNWKSDFHIGVRLTTGRKLMAFISAVPVTLRISEASFVASEVNFLCIHKKLRSKRLTPVLVREITRRSHLIGIQQGIYTAGVHLPEPFCTTQYFHRPLNVAKLISSGFCGEVEDDAAPKLHKMFQLKKPATMLPFELKMVEKQDLYELFDIFNSYIEKFKVKPRFTFEEFCHWTLPIENVLYSFAIVSKANGEILGYYSFYSIPSSVLDPNCLSTKASIIDQLQVAYSFYYALKNESVSLFEVTNLILNKAAELKFDVFNALDILDNASVLDRCRFSPGDGFLNYYLYNWMLNRVQPSELGFILL